MSKMIQIRNVPEPLHRALKARASLEGTSLSDYLLEAVAELAERPTVEEIKARLNSRSAVRLTVPPARMVRKERDRR